jgi:lipopolysaccharide transport system ATP-binding protein
MSDLAIRVEDLWKEYTVGDSLVRATFYDALGRLLRRPDEAAQARRKFWALQGVDFELRGGEVLGVVGRNGAGKSTLLKILSRITAPTRGRARVRGRVASLLEVGTGFHPELTGRENIFLNATILGMTRGEIQRKLDAIVEFAGIGRFLDTPVKRYSSGMYVRLAFAVAAHVEADILLVDEVLAVGDAEFQKRCMGLMGEVARGGRTILFVSHNLTALRNLCTQGLLLQAGQVAAQGPIAEVLEQYVARSEREGEVVLEPHPAASSADAAITRVRVVPNGDQPGATIRGTQGCRIEIDVRVPAADKLDIFIHCHNEQQVMVFSSGSFRAASGDSSVAPGGHRFTCEVPGYVLNDGSYTLDVMLVRNRQEVVVSEQAVLSFTVSDDFPAPEGWHWRRLGAVRPDLAWERSRL